MMIDLARWGDAALLYGAARASRERLALPASPQELSDFEEPLARARAALGHRWGELVAAAALVTVEEACARVFAGAESPTDTPDRP